MVQKSFSTLEVEAALCAWEHMAESIYGEDGPRNPVMHAAFERNGGTTAFRHFAMTLSPSIVAAYELLSEDEVDGFAYDWDIVPGMLEAVDWNARTLEVPTPEAMAQAWRESLKRSLSKISPKTTL